MLIVEEYEVIIIHRKFNQNNDTMSRTRKTERELK